MEDTNQPRPECPRCGYDLSGQVRTWTEACPLAGVCTECGFEVEYRFVLNPGLTARWRYFETAVSRPLGAWWETSRKALRAWVFWSWVRMYHWPHLGRMIGGAVAAGVFWYSVMGLFWSVVNVAAIWLLNPELPPAEALAFWWESFQTLFLYPLGIAVRPFTLSAGFIAGVQPGALVPFLLAPAVTLMVPLCFLALPLTLRRAKVRPVHLVRITAWSVVTPLLIVQPLLLPGIVLGIARVFTSAEWLWWRFYERREQTILVVVGLWLWCWWGLACRRYLALPRAWMVALAMVVMALLLVLALCSPYPQLFRRLVF